MDSFTKDRAEIAASLGIEKCENCPSFCPYCPRLLAVRPDLDYLPKSVIQRVVHQSTPDPSLFQKATHFAGAIAQHLAAGLPHADEETIKHRLDVCRNCEHFNAEHSSCRKCGCNMTIKVRWTEQRCPVGKW